MESANKKTGNIGGKIKRISGFSAKLTIIISVVLLAFNLLLGAVLVGNSKAAMRTLIQNRMLDISKSAAAMLNGDDLKTLKAEDEGTEVYQKINDTLVVFQDNIDLRYIYCVRKIGEKQFVFTVDPTIEDPGLFGDPVVYTEALDKASQGTAAVDEEPYTDSWGKFYSAYSPVFDSDGNVSGIVAVDFSAEWYDEQISKQTKVIFINSFLAVLLGALLVFFATKELRNQLKLMTMEISEVASDIDELTKEINPSEVKITEESYNSDAVKELSHRIHQIKEDLREYSKNLHSQANSMITALSSEYRSVYYIDLDKNEGVCYQSHSQLDNGLKPGEHFSYIETLVSYAEKYVTDKYREDFLNFVNPDQIRKGLESERIITYRYMTDRNGLESYEMIRMAGVRHPEDRDDHIVHAIGLGFTDVDAETRKTLTQSQALSDALAAAESANKAKTAFLSNMSHEIRTPMNAIIGLDRIALNDTDLSENTRDYLEKIGTSADHLLKIINDILDMSRIEAGRMVIRNEVFSLSELLNQINVMVEGQCKDKGINWKWERVGDTGDYYVGDDMKLKQVFINILGNSVKFTEEGGEIDFTIERVAHYDKQSVFRFVIKDTGIGMSEEYLPKLFEPFSQEDLTTKTKYGSTGLGMPITKSIIEMMNGEISVESKKNVGTTFTIKITLADSDQKYDGIGEISPNEISVLIVDDDPVACDFAQVELEKVGVSVQIAHSGQEAVEMVRLKDARREQFSLILVDWKMPEMDGIETTSKIREIIGNESAIVILTAYHWDEILEEAKKAGVDSFMSKPLNANSILQQFGKAVALKEQNKKSKAELKGRHILLAEDVAVNAKIAMMLLKKREIEVDHAENGKLAVELFESHPDGYYDAILMDMRMPEMDGLEATRAIRALERADAGTIPIIALTANAFDEDVQRSLQSGLNAHLSKPIEPEMLYETLESLIK